MARVKRGAGFGKSPAVAVGLAKLRPRRVVVGGRLSFAVALRSSGTLTQRLAVAFAVELPGAGALRRRVFKLATLDLEADQVETLRGSVDLAPLRTVAGRHRLDLLVNGVAYPLGGFAVVAPGRASPRKG